MLRLFLTLLLTLATAPAWAFPQNGVLDAFTGCVDTTTPPNANWTNAIFSGASSSTVDCEDTAATSTSSGTQAEAYWNPTTFGANVEAYGTWTTGMGDRLGVCVRLVNIGASTTDGYCVFSDNTGDTIGISRFDNGAETGLGSDTQAPSAGDDVGITAIGSQICSWYRAGAGVWTQIRCVTDTTYLAGGRIGIAVIGNTATGLLDDFGGGNITVPKGGVILFQ